VELKTSGIDRPEQKITDTAQEEKDRVAEFDILRALAITLLLFHHGGIYNFSVFGFSLKPLMHYMELLLLGSFVFMSGYFSISSLKRSSFGDFLKTRLLRIYIPYIAALGLFILLLELDVSAADIAIHLLGGQMLLSPQFTSPILTLWYIGLILVFYVLFGVLYKTIRSPLLLFAVLVAIFLLAALVRMEWGFIARRFFYYFFIYLAGFFTARQGWLQALISTRFFLLDKVLALAAGAALLAPVQDRVGQGIDPQLLVAVNAYILSVVIFTLSLARLLSPRLAHHKFISTLSYASFFMYLSHRPIWALLLELYQPSSLQALSLYLIVVGGAAVLIFSYYLQRFYNRLLLLRRPAPQR
jgi:peptidoglycan/LPS O-acetylase OafA/YrhL